MIDPSIGKMPRGLTFVAVNAGAVLLLIVLVIAPVLAHFASASGDIAESAAELAHLRTVVRNANVLSSSSRQLGDAFLPGNDERVVSADLQANLKDMATRAGAHIIGMRSDPASRPPKLHMVAVSMELEGSPAVVRELILAIEGQTPLLVVTALSLRSLMEGDGGLLRADLKVQGAMRDSVGQADSDLEPSDQGPRQDFSPAERLP